jgi:hypothetical protein
MARGGNPNLTWIEDRVIVAAHRGNSSELPKGSLEDFANVQSFLKSEFPDVGDDIVEEFLNTANRVRSDYLFILVLETKGVKVSRTSVGKKYNRLLATLIDFHKAFVATAGPPWELIRHVVCSGRPDESAPTRAKYDALDFERFNEQLMSLFGPISKIVRSLKGTAQDRTRPERYLIHELWSKWMALGFPEPRLVRGADSREVDAPDEDAFAETVWLVFDTIYADTKRIDGLDGEVTYALRTVIEAGKKKLRARK